MQYAWLAGWLVSNLERSDEGECLLSPEAKSCCDSDMHAQDRTSPPSHVLSRPPTPDRFSLSLVYYRADNTVQYRAVQYNTCRSKYNTLDLQIRAR